MRARFVVLTGRHEGATAAVDSAVTLVGSSGDYDIVLTDPGVAALHASVAFNAEGRPVVRWHAPPADRAPATAASADGSRGAANDEAFPDRRPAEPDWYEPWQIGPVWVALAPAHFEWKQSMRWPRPDDAPAPAATGRARRTLLWSLAGVGLAGGLLLATGAGRSFAGAEPPAASAATAAAQAQQLRQRITQLGLADVTLDTGGNGNGKGTGTGARNGASTSTSTSTDWALTGFVATQSERDALAQAARAVRPGIALRVTVGDELVQRAREFLVDPGSQPRYTGAGRLQLAGKPQQLTEAAALERSLSQLRADLGAAVTLADALDRSQLRVAAAEPVVHPLPVRISEVHADEPAHFRDAGGARYFEGARLADGAEVVRIRADEILFRRNGREIRYAVVD